jgi:hypothetical protein
VLRLEVAHRYSSLFKAENAVSDDSDDGTVPPIPAWPPNDLQRE